CFFFVNPYPAFSSPTACTLQRTSFLAQSLTARASWVQRREILDRVQKPSKEDSAEVEQLERESKELMQEQVQRSRYSHFLAKTATTSFVMVSSVIVGKAVSWWLVVALVVVLVYALRKLW